MTSTVATDVLLHASDTSSRLHRSAFELLQQLAGGGPEPFCIFWPVALAYVRIATDASVFDRPLSTDTAKANIAALLDRPNVQAVGEDDDFWEAYGHAAGSVFMRGDFVAKGYLVALMRQHAVGTLWSNDREFRQFPGIAVRELGARPVGR